MLGAVDRDAGTLAEQLSGNKGMMGGRGGGEERIKDSCDHAGGLRGEWRSRGDRHEMRVLGNMSVRSSYCVVVGSDGRLRRKSICSGYGRRSGGRVCEEIQGVLTDCMKSHH